MFRRLKIWRGSGGMFKKILIANRGEIAVRIIRACRELGIGSVAVFSEADREAMHVRLADEAYPIGPPHPLESYLDVGRILEAARRAKVQAIHPGYGFLAENAAFARAVERAGFVFIGPSGDCLDLLRDKVRAKEAAERVGVPVVPGADQLTAENVGELAKEVGYPLLLKSVAGGGGRGSRVVAKARDLPERFEQSTKEARWSFANPELFMEKLLKRPRHVGVQIVADRHGGIAHLLDHEASVQRRNQKIIEEAPAPAVDDKLRRQLTKAATAIAREVGLTIAGSVEFLIDGDGKFYFIGVNGRIQVEHPVTELICGIDLVGLQIELAAGDRIPFDPDTVWQGQHAIQMRVTAEDPASGFMPSAGRIRDLELPGGSSIRVDSGIHVGQDVSLYYDPLLLKIATVGRDRTEALSRLDRALAEFHIDGVATSAPYLRRFLKYKPFFTGAYNINVLERFLSSIDGAKTDTPLETIFSAAALITQDRLHRGLGEADRAVRGDRADPWLMAARWGGLRGGMMR